MNVSTLIKCKGIYFSIVFYSYRLSRIIDLGECFNRFAYFDTFGTVAVDTWVVDDNLRSFPERLFFSIVVLFTIALCPYIVNVY